MFKKAFAVVALAGALVLGTAAAASADPYPPEVSCTVSPTPVTVGATATIACTGFDLPTALFGVQSGDGSLSSIVLADADPVVVEKPVTNGAASATYTAPSTPGTYTVLVAQTDGEVVEDVAEVSVTVAAAGSGAGSGSGALPATGGTVPGAFIWLGVGAIGLGGIAVAAAVARRRAAGNR
ncbi:MULTISPECIES: LPXTG cell wall anchor domain-containing protein [Microbacterium]|uniref:LPXTG cell wall anchor domain-containing protein n=1 Tax=Microbacterium TaxID=33882 RepID=UPI000D655C27|nr:MULTISPECIES: LPXTG cell wall anchor domain-containing protein [Microbacterium]